MLKAGAEPALDRALINSGGILKVGLILNFRYACKRAAVPFRTKLGLRLTGRLKDLLVELLAGLVAFFDGAGVA